MTWNKAFDLSELQKNKRDTITIGDHKILLIWHQDKVHAIQAQCPHLKMPLKNGCIEEDIITCPFHKSAFNINTGAIKCWSPWPKVIGPLLGKLSKPHALHVYNTRIEDEQIFVEIP